MFLVEFFFVGLVLPLANSNYEYQGNEYLDEYDYDPNSNYDPNVTIEDCNGPETSENGCFCYNEPETNIPYSICKESVLPSGMVMCNTSYRDQINIIFWNNVGAPVGKEQRETKFNFGTIFLAEYCFTFMRLRLKDGSI